MFKILALPEPITITSFTKQGLGFKQSQEVANVCVVAVITLPQELSINT
jgi:hypothetical protein